MARRRFLERRRTEAFRRRQRFYRLLGPGLLLLAAVVADACFLLRWDPFYNDGRPLAPLWTAARFLAVNFFVARLLLHLWFEVRYVVGRAVLRRAPWFALQAVLLALPFTLPLLGLFGYTVHAPAAFAGRFPATRHSWHLSQARPEKCFEDARYLYCAYAETGAAGGGGEAVRVIRCRKDAIPRVRAIRDRLTTELAEALDRTPPERQDALMADLAKREDEALRGLVEVSAVGVVPSGAEAQISFRTRGRRLYVLWASGARVRRAFTEDRGASWSEFSEISAGDPGLARLPPVGDRFIRVSSGEAFIGSQRGIELGSLSGWQLVETPEAAHLLFIREGRLCHARYDKAPGAWGRPFRGRAGLIEQLRSEARALAGGRTIPGLGGGGATPELDGLRGECRKRLRRADELKRRLDALEKEYAGGRTHLGLVERKLLAIEGKLRPEAATAAGPGPALSADMDDFEAAVARMNAVRDALDRTRDALYAADDLLDGVAAALDDAAAGLRENRALFDSFRELLIGALVKRAVPAEEQLRRFRDQKDVEEEELRRALQHMFQGGVEWFEEWSKLDRRRRELLLAARVPVLTSLPEARERMDALLRTLDGAQRQARALLGEIENLRARLDLPYRVIPLDGAGAPERCALYRGRGSGGPSLLARVRVRPDDDGAPPRTIWLGSRDDGATWRSLRGRPSFSRLAGHTLLLGTDADGRGVLDRLIAGSRFYFRPAVIGASLLIAFAFSTVLALLSAAVCRPRIRWQYLFIRLSNVLINGISSLPAIIVLICVFVAVASRAGGAADYDWILVFAIVFTQIPSVYNYVHDAVAHYRDSEMLAHDLNIGLSWTRIVIGRILRERCLGIFLIQAFYILGYVILFETTLSYLGFAPPGDLDSWGKLLVEEGRLPMARFLQAGEAGANPLVFAAPLAMILFTIYATNCIGRLLTRSLRDERVQGGR